MKHLVLVFCGVPMTCYVAQAGFYFFHQGRYGLTITMVCYAIANLGVIFDAYEYTDNHRREKVEIREAFWENRQRETD